MKYFLISLFLLGLTGCNNLPTMKYCDRISYVRDGQMIHIEADCRTYIQDPVVIPYYVF